MHTLTYKERDGEIQRKGETQVLSWQIHEFSIHLKGEFLPQSCGGLGYRVSIIPPRPQG